MAEQARRGEYAVREAAFQIPHDPGTILQQELTQREAPR
jgi:hypothetical protein